MKQIHIVTDSCASFANAQFVQQNPITIVPNRIEISGQVYREGVDIQDADALNLMSKLKTPPKINPPTVADYNKVYQQLAPQNDVIISIHASREIYQSWYHAQEAALQNAGQCEIVVLDSETLCVGQGMLVQVALQSAQKGMESDDIVRAVRGAIDRLYASYYVEKVDFLAHSQIMAPSHVLLGAMQNIKPFLTFEEGRIQVTEKVKTRLQAIEYLIEFATEFVDIENMAILQNRSQLTEHTRMLQDRLMTDFADLRIPHLVYRPSLAALIGADATGIVVLEEENDF